MIKKKILIVIPYLYDGGAERVASLWANDLAEFQNYEVHLLTYFRLEKEYELSDNVIRHSIFEKKEDYKLHKILRFIIDSKAIGKYIKEVKPDYVIPFSHITCICTSIGNKNRSTIIHTIRNNPWLEPNIKLMRLLRDHYIKKDKYLIVQNEEQSEYFASFKKIKSFVVSNPVNDRCLPLSKSKYGDVKSIIAVGRLADQKNYFFMIDAIEQAKARGYDVHLDIYGDGYLKDEIQKYINSKGLNEVVILKGNSKNIYELMINYDLFLMTSKFEGFPNSLLEAMTLGVPVISTDCKTGPRSLIKHHHNGLLAKNDNVDDVANNIIYMIEHNSDAKEYALNAKEYARSEYSKENVKKQLDNVISSIES